MRRWLQNQINVVIIPLYMKMRIERGFIMKTTKQSTIWNILPIVIPLFAAVLCMGAVLSRNNQASLSVPLPVQVSGEYSYDGQTWLPLQEESGISALDGDLMVRGHFTEEITEGACLNYYRDHIGVSLYVNGQLVFIDAQTEVGQYGIGLMDSMCGKEWQGLLSPGITKEDQIEIHLVNYHKYGNKAAYRELMNTLCITPDSDEILEGRLRGYRKPFHLLGSALIVLALLLLGAALASAIFRSKDGIRLLKYGLLTLAAGGYIIFDTVAVFLQSELVAVQTYGWQFSMMFFVYLLGLVLLDALSENRKMIAQKAMIVSGLLDMVCIMLAMLGKMLIFDTLPVWVVSQWILCPLLAVCCLLEMGRGEKKEGFIQFSCLMLFFSIMLDLAGVGKCMYSQGNCTKVVFVLLCIVYLGYMVKQILMDQSASARVKRLEQDLADRQTKIVLSQIQQHFVYNCLAVIRVLCKQDPELASEAIMRFSNFLRGIMEDLEKTELVPLEDELYIVDNYLFMEKLRFQHKLHVEKDIQAKNFCLPALAIQPIVENAIKHGLRQKSGKGTISISTRETDADYVVEIADDGVGFDVDRIYSDDAGHIGIKNVDKRLRVMCNGYLEMHSVPNEGSRFCLHIPKKHANIF